MICVFDCFILCFKSSIFAGHTYLREPKLCYDLLELLSMLPLNFYELWNCSSASLISFWARCPLIFLKKYSLASRRFIWDFSKLLKKFSHASLKLFWEKEKFYAPVLHLNLFELSKETYETSPKVIDIKEGYNKNFHIDHWKW